MAKPQPMGDKEMLNDGLSSAKATTNLYNTFANECVSQQVKNEFMSILTEEHQIQSDIFMELQKRGWYQTAPAEPAKVTQTKTKFTGQNPAY